MSSTHYSRFEFAASAGHREETLLLLGLDAGEVADLVSFLRSLSGKPLPTSLLTQPASPSLPR